MLQGTFVVDLNAMVLGMPRALFPALALVRFHGGANTVGLLYAAPRSRGSDRCAANGLGRHGPQAGPGCSRRGWDVGRRNCRIRPCALAGGGP